MKFEVTESSMRPASDKRECFYCRRPIGESHADDCVLVLRRVKVRMIVDYEIEVPAHWDQYMIEFHRNDSSWCASSAIDELQAIHEAENCICNHTSFEYLGETDGKRLLKELR